MGNILLDKLPQDYEGYLIRTDFGIGIQITLCAADPELSEYEKTAIMLNLLYGRGMPDFEEAVKGLGWFLNCGKQIPKDEPDNSSPVMSFDVDDTRIYSAFRKVYGIDLQVQRIHWFQFISYLQDLSGTTYNNVIDLRQTRADEIEPKKRAEFARMQKRFSLPNSYTEEEQSAISEFRAQLNAGENEP